MRIEDLDRDRSREGLIAEQLADLEAIGIDWDGEPVRQSQRTGLYAEALRQLDAQGLTYPCWCTRGELAATAPHGAQRPYPGTCRDLTRAQAAMKGEHGREPAIRVRLEGKTVAWDDGVLGPMQGIADDPIVRRSSGDFAYNLAVVVDDAAQGIREVVRGDDLAASVPTQAALLDALGLERPQWTHVRLVTGEDGRRLSKRHGGTTLAEWLAGGASAQDLVGLLASSLGIGDSRARPPAELLGAFDRGRLVAGPWTWPADRAA